jgi:GDP-D-mannose dehydratase
VSQSQWEQWYKKQSEKLLVAITTLGNHIEKHKQEKERNLTTLDLADLQSWIRVAFQYIRGSVEVQQNLSREVRQDRDQFDATIRQHTVTVNKLVALENEVKSIKADIEKTLNEINTSINMWIERWTPMLQEIEEERSHLSRVGSPPQPE